MSRWRIPASSDGPIRATTSAIWSLISTVGVSPTDCGKAGGGTCGLEESAAKTSTPPKIPPIKPAIKASNSQPTRWPERQGT